MIHAAAKAYVRSAATAIATFASDHGGEYSGATVADLRAVEPTLQGANLAVVEADDRSYELTVTSTSGNLFSIGRLADGSSNFACTQPGDAGCPASGSWAG